MSIDTHAHITNEFYTDIPQILSRSIQNGVHQIIVPGTNLSDSNSINQYKDPLLRYAVGIHPDESSYNIDKKQIFDLITDETIAIGECGIDLSREQDKKVQEKLFRIQIEIAIEKKLPIIIHTRNALRETYDILSSYYHKGNNNIGVVHSADGDINILNKLIDIGFYLSFNGISTYKSADNIRNIIREVSIHKILVETDAPFLNPKGSKTKQNESANIKYVIDNINTVKGIHNTEEITENNAKLLFRL